MEVIKTAIDGVLILEPRIFKDARGYFFESFSSREFEEKVCKTTFVQDNESFSGYGVVRGLHFQKPPFTHSKIVRVIKGSVLDVAVDLRQSSPTFGKYVSAELSEENQRQFFTGDRERNKVSNRPFCGGRRQGAGQGDSLAATGRSSGKKPRRFVLG